MGINFDRLSEKIKHPRNKMEIMNTIKTYERICYNAKKQNDGETIAIFYNKILQLIESCLIIPSLTIIQIEAIGKTKTKVEQYLKEVEQDGSNGTDTHND